MSKHNYGWTREAWLRYRAWAELYFSTILNAHYRHIHINPDNHNDERGD